eukprot:3846145-Pleurochrysis_carterae.AAC.2
MHAVVELCTLARRPCKRRERAAAVQPVPSPPCVRPTSRSEARCDPRCALSRVASRAFVLVGELFALARRSTPSPRTSSTVRATSWKHC